MIPSWRSSAPRSSATAMALRSARPSHGERASGRLRPGQAAPSFQWEPELLEARRKHYEEVKRKSEKDRAGQPAKQGIAPSVPGGTRMVRSGSTSAAVGGTARRHHGRQSPRRGLATRLVPRTADHELAAEMRPGLGQRPALCGSISGLLGQATEQERLQLGRDRLPRSSDGGSGRRSRAVTGSRRRCVPRTVGRPASRK